jgi:uncharacterized protein
MRAFIQRHPVATYYVSVFAISWGGGVIVLGPGGIWGARPITASQLPFVYLTAIAGPSVASIVSTLLVYGRAGLRELLSRLLRWRVSARWYAVALLTAPLLVMATLLGLSLTPAIVTASDKTGLLVSGIAAALVVPPFEELGWTGFAIPELRTRYGIVTTGVIVGLLWGAWHLPLFAWSARSSATIPPALYLAVLLFSWLPPYRVLMVWVYDRTKSLLAAVLMHVPIVVTSLVLAPATAPNVIVTYDVVFAGALWVVVGIVVLAGRFASVAASSVEKERPMRGDGLVSSPMFAVTHAVTIDAPPESVWPWLAQMGAERAGWYSLDWIDNGGRRSADRVLGEYQDVRRGDVLPALPGATDPFVVADVEPPHDILLTVGGDIEPIVSWEHLVEPIGQGRSRLIVRGRVGSAWKRMARAAGGERPRFIEKIYRLLGRLPNPLMVAFASMGHRWMEARHMRGIKRRVEAVA